MIVKNQNEVVQNKVTMDGVKGVFIQWLIGEDSGAPNFYLRLFEVEPGGHTPFHDHPWEHEVFILEGKGAINTTGSSHPLEKGSFALLLPDEKHQFENKGDTPLKFLCIIPKDTK